MYVQGIAALSAAVRGFQIEGRRIAQRIAAAKGPERDRLWNLKRALGQNCRCHILALGILRGRSYERMERCAASNRPNVKVVQALLEAHNAWVLGRPYVRYDLAIVQALLTPPTAPTLTHEKGV